jgi:hypothetical protein
MSGCKEEEIKLRWSAFEWMNIVFKSNIPLCLKNKAYDQCVLPVMTYGCETWMLNSRMLRNIQCTQRSMERCILGITRRVRKRNTWVRSMTKVADIAERVKIFKWTHSEKNGWQMDARNTGMVSERM